MAIKTPLVSKPISLEILKYIPRYDGTPYKLSNFISTLQDIYAVHCSIHNDYLFYFIQFPLKSLTCETFFLLSYPVLKGKEIVTIHVHPSLVIRDNELLTGNCVLINENYYCKNITLVENKCVNQILEDRDLNDCELLVIKNVSPFIKFIPIINQYLMYNVTKIIVNINFQNFTLNPKFVQLMYLNSSEYLLNYSKPYVYWESNVMPPSEVPKFKSYTNFTFDQIHEANINVQPLETIDEIHLDDHKFIYYLLIVILIFFSCCNSIPKQNC